MRRKRRRTIRVWWVMKINSILLIDDGKYHISNMNYEQQSVEQTTCWRFFGHMLPHAMLPVYSFGARPCKIKFYHAISYIWACGWWWKRTVWFLFVVGSFRQMRVSTASSSISMKTSKEAMAKDTHGLDGVTGKSNFSVHGYVSSQLNATLLSPPSPPGWLGKMLGFLRKLLVVLGLLPGGTGGPKHSFWSILKICLSALTVGFLSSAYIVIQCKGSMQIKCFSVFIIP